jgi:hypothetical protein
MTRAQYSPYRHLKTGSIAACAQMSQFGHKRKCWRFKIKSALPL